MDMIVSKKRITDIRKRTKNTGSMQAIKRVGLDPARERERERERDGLCELGLAKKKMKETIRA